MEQIEASIARYILSAAGAGVTPYYNDLEEGFKVPSVFFPETETGTTREDFDTYAFNNAWYVKFFHSTTDQAKALAKKVLAKIVGGRYYVPIVNEDGTYTNRKIRISRAEIKKIDSGVYQMWLDWDESYEYDDLSNKSEKMQTYDISLNFKKEV